MGTFSSVSTVVHVLGRVSPGGVRPLGTVFSLPKQGLFGTVAHLSGGDDRDLVITTKNIGSLDDYQDTSDRKCGIVPVKLHAIDPIHDLCVLKAEIKVESTLAIGSTDEIQVGESVALFGFPHADSGRVVLTQQNTEVGARILIEASGIKTKHIVLNIQSRPGQSGSPVLNLRTGKLVALLVGSYAPGGGGRISLGGIDPHTLHQTTHAVSVEYILPMLDI